MIFKLQTIQARTPGMKCVDHRLCGILKRFLSCLSSFSFILHTILLFYFLPDPPVFVFVLVVKRFAHPIFCPHPIFCSELEFIFVLVYAWLGQASKLFAYFLIGISHSDFPIEIPHPQARRTARNERYIVCEWRL